jgi:hypothetical protein
MYRVIRGCRGPTNNTVKAGHRHGAVLLVVRAFVHPALCSVEQRGSDSIPSFLALAPALFDCRGGLKENYYFFIIFFGREFASLLHDKKKI